MEEFYQLLFYYKMACKGDAYNIEYSGTVDGRMGICLSARRSMWTWCTSSMEEKLLISSLVIGLVNST